MEERDGCTNGKVEEDDEGTVQMCSFTCLCKRWMSRRAPVKSVGDSIINEAKNNNGFGHAIDEWDLSQLFFQYSFSIRICQSKLNYEAGRPRM